MKDFGERKELYHALCELLPYDVLVNHTNSNCRGLLTGIDRWGRVMLEDPNEEIVFFPTDVFGVKPYLRRLHISEKEWLQIRREVNSHISISNGKPYFAWDSENTQENNKKLLDWYKAHHYDIWGLLDKDLAIEKK